MLYRLSLSQKFIILGLLGLVMVVVPSFLYFRMVMAQMDVAKTESKASASVTGMNHVIQWIQTHRGMSAGALNGNEALQSRRPAMRDKVNQSISELDVELDKAQASGTLLAEWKAIKITWLALEQGVSDKALKSAESTQKHTQLIKGLLQFNDNILSEFGLSLDPRCRHLLFDSIQLGEHARPG